MYYHMTTFGWSIGLGIWLREIGIMVASLVLFITGYLVYQRHKERRKLGVESKELINQLMEEAMEEDSITCPDCCEILEVDEAKCLCGWENPLVKEGLIR